MLSLYEKIKIRLIILFLLAALSFIGLFFIINYQLVSERAVKRTDSRFELIQKNVGYFFKDIERSALTLKDSLYLLKNTEEIQRAVILKMEMMPFLDSVGLVLDDNKYYLFSRRANDKIVVYHQEEVNGPLVDESGRVIFADFNPSKRPWSVASDDSNNSWNPAYNCFDRPGKKCISFTLRINGKDHDLLAVDKIHVDLNWRYLNEYLDQISANDEVLFLKQGHEIIAKNQLAREKLIIYNSEGNYNIIDSVDTEYIEKTSVVPNNALFEIYFYYPGGNLLNASDKLFYLPFAFIIIVLLVVYLMTTRVFRRQFSEMTELVNTLAFLPDSTDQIEALKIREGDAKEIISIKNSIAEMKDAEIERSNKLLSLISYDQESGFIKNMAIIESNNNQYLAVGIIKLCGLEAVEAVFGVDERNKIVRKLCQRIAEKYAQCCDIVTFNADLYLQTNAVQSGMSTPLLKSGEDTVLACDIGGSTICAVKKGKGTVFQDRLDGTILDADLADDGALCYALATKSDKTLLTVLDAEQNEIYRWYSETAYFNQCAVSSSGTNLAGIRLGQQNNDFLSTAVLFRTDREEPVAELALGNALYLDLAFLASRTLCAIGENDAVFFSIDGKQTGIYDYEGAYLTHYSLDGSGFVAVATNHNRTGGTPVLTTLDTAGKPMASLELAGEILDLSAAGNYLAVLTTKGLTIYNARLKVCGQTADTSTASRVVARSDGTALLVSGDRAELFAG